MQKINRKEQTMDKEVRKQKNKYQIKANTRVREQEGKNPKKNKKIKRQ